MMTQRTNSTARASKCRNLAKQFSEEAKLWTGRRSHRRLTAAALQLGYMARAAHALDADAIEAYIETAEGLLAGAMTARAFGGAL
jgi:hypothetical protein